MEDTINIEEILRDLGIDPIWAKKFSGSKAKELKDWLCGSHYNSQIRLLHKYQQINAPEFETELVVKINTAREELLKMSGAEFAEKLEELDLSTKVSFGTYRVAFEDAERYKKEKAMLIQQSEAMINKLNLTTGRMAKVAAHLSFGAIFSYPIPIIDEEIRFEFAKKYLFVTKAGLYFVSNFRYVNSNPYRYETDDDLMSFLTEQANTFIRTAQLDSLFRPQRNVVGAMKLMGSYTGDDPTYKMKTLTGEEIGAKRIAKIICNAVKPTINIGDRLIFFTDSLFGASEVLKNRKILRNSGFAVHVSDPVIRIIGPFDILYRGTRSITPPKGFEFLISVKPKKRKPANYRSHEYYF